MENVSVVSSEVSVEDILVQQWMELSGEDVLEVVEIS